MGWLKAETVRISLQVLLSGVQCYVSETKEGVGGSFSSQREDLTLLLVGVGENIYELPANLFPDQHFSTERGKEVIGVYEEILDFLPRATVQLSITYNEI